LPSTPLKATERRGDRWREVMQHEQTEIDALAALNPDELRRIARNAIKPFYDNTLSRRAAASRRNWFTEADAILASHPDYQSAVERITELFNQLYEAADNLHEAQSDAADAFTGIQLPPIVPAEPEITIEAPSPLFTTADDYADATRRLIAHKALET
jgi:hypothetical protein